jgi:transglutaminase-like putative cysteine protease
MAARRPASLVNVSRAGLTLAAAYGLERVFAGGSWFFAIAFAALLPPALFVLAERRRWHPVVLPLVLVVTGLLLAILVDDPSETIAGIPTSAAFSQFGGDISNAAHVLRTAKVPVAPNGAALVLAIVAAFVTAIITELVARQLEAPVGAIGPSMALLVVVNALGSGPWAAFTACYALVVIAYLAALQHSELTARRTWFHTERSRSSQAVTGGLLVGAVVVVLATAFGPLFPGARASAWINYRSLGSGNGDSVLRADDPLVSIGAKLNPNRPNQEVFTVVSAAPYHWRIVALDKFQDGDWGIDESHSSLASLPGVSKIPNSTLVTQTIHLENIDPVWLPAAYRPVKIKVKGANLLRDTATIYVDKNVKLAGITYTVESEIADPSQSQLEQVTMGDLRGQEADTAPPPGLSDRVHQLALDVTAGGKTPYDKMKLLQEYFQNRNNFQYRLDVNLGSDTHALENFLFKVKKGFCQQFASAFAEMARSLGIPARVAVGYEPGAPQDGVYHVTEQQAHAWPEIWMGNDIGWYAFEPTPGHFNTSDGQGDPHVPGGTPTGPTPTTTTLPGSTTPRTTPVTQPKLRPQPLPQHVTPPKHTTHSQRTGDVVLSAVGVLLVALVGGFVWLFGRARRRTKRLRAQPDPRRRVIGAWTEALERLAVAGVEPRVSATAVEFALRQAPAQGAGAAGPALMDLARLQTAAMYAREEPSTEDGETAWQRYDAIDAALRKSVRRTDRFVARLKPRRRRRTPARVG